MAFVLHMCVSCYKTFYMVPYFDLVDMKFDLLFETLTLAAI